MKRRIAGILLLAASAAASAQIQSGTGIGSNTASGGTASVNEPAPLPPAPSTGPNPESAVSQSSAPRSPDDAGRSSGRCDSLAEQERAQCLREQASTVRPPPASTGSTGPGSTGTGSGAVK